jgi:hypothetical protein
MEPEPNPLDLLRQRRAINRVEAAMRKTEEVPKPGGYRYLGRNADTGQGIVVGNDGSVIPGDIITSGHIKPGQAVRVAQAGGMVQLDQKPRVRKVVPPVVKKEESGPVKILFSVVEGAERIYYVGGDRRTPKELFRLPTPASAIAHLVATGKGLRAFYWQYVTSELFDSRLGDSYAGTMGSVQYFGSGVFLGSSATNIRNEFSDTGGFRNIGTTTRTDWRTNDLENQSFVNAGSAVFTYDGQRTITPFPDPVPKVFPATGTVTDVESSSRSGFFDAGGFRFLSQGSNSTNRLNTTTEFNTDPPTPIVSTWSSSIAENFRQENPLLIGLSGALKTVQTSSFTSSGSAVLNQNPIIYGPDHGTRLDFVTQDDVVTVSSPQKTLIESRLISPRYSTLAGSTLWVLGDTVSSTVTQLSGGQSFINLLGIDLLSSESAPQKVKIFPIPQGAPLIHSISYTP